MPALEIMPQCATMEEAQRRANIQRGLALPEPRPRVHSPSARPETSTDDNDNNNRSTTSSPKPSPTRRLARFVKRNLRGLRRRSYPPYNESDTNCKDETDSEPYCGGTGTKKVPVVQGTRRATNPGFSPIGVKYWPKIMEDEEEEPPEALHFDSSWRSSNNGKN